MVINTILERSESLAQRAAIAELSRTSPAEKVIDCRDMEWQIRQALPDESGCLTALAHAAKRHWGYPESWIAQWRVDLTITPAFIAAHDVLVATIAGEVVGCCALVLTGLTAEVEHMW